MSAAVERSVKAILKAEVGEYVANMERARKATESLHTVMQGGAKKSSESLNLLSNRLGFLGAGMTAFSVLAVKRFADFDQAMDGVQAATHESTENMNALRDASLEAGKTTVFSATESAGAVEALAKAGVATGDILGGGLKGSLDLAAAGELEVGDAAEIAATAMTQFNLKGRDVTHIADLLAAGAGKAQGEVSDLSMALKQSGLVASQFGISIDETVGTLSAFASAGLLGSDAGTSFRTMLLYLSNPTKESAQLMRELGISAYDARGDFVGMAALAGQLKRSLDPLPQAQRDAALATMFGSDAIRSANVLYKQGERGIRDWTAAVDDQGYAAETAAIKLDNLKGDWEAFSGSVETALIGMGEGADGSLRLVVQSAGDVVDAFSSLPDTVQQGTLAIIGGAGLVALGTAGRGKLVIAVNDVKTAMAAMNITMGKGAAAASGIGAAVAIGTLALASWANKQAEAKRRTDELRGSLDEATGAVTENTRATIANQLQSDGTVKMARELGIELDVLADAALGQKAAMDLLKQGSADAEKAFQAALAANDGQSSAASVELETRYQTWLALMRNLGVATGQVEASQRDWREEQEMGVKSAGAQAGATDATRTAVSRYSDALGAGVGSIEAYADALQEVIDAQREAAGTVLSEREAQRQYEAALDDVTAALKENGITLDITTAAGRTNQAALDDVATSTWDLIDAMRANGSTQTELQAVMAASRQAFIDSATAAGMSADEANRLADELGLIPEDVKVTVTADTKQANSAVDALLAKIAGARPTIYPNIGDPRNVGRVLGGGYVTGFAAGGSVRGPRNVARSQLIAPALANGARP